MDYRPTKTNDPTGYPVFRGVVNGCKWASLRAPRFDASMRGVLFPDGAFVESLTVKQHDDGTATVTAVYRNGCDGCRRLAA